MGAAVAAVITSTRNTRVAAAARLHRARERRATGRYLVEGVRALGPYLAGDQIDRVFVTTELEERYRDVPADVVVVAPHVLGRLADARTPQGVVAVVRRREVGLEDVVGDGVLAVLDRVADPGNAGTVIRTAEAFGVRGVALTSGSVDPYNPKAVRASAGTLARARVVTDVSLDDLAAACRERGQPLVGLTAEGAGEVDELRSLPWPVAVVMGSEAHGLRPDDLRSLDRTVAIRMAGGAESLNLAAAAAIALHAATRTRR